MTQLNHLMSNSINSLKKAKNNEISRRVEGTSRYFPMHFINKKYSLAMEICFLLNHRPANKRIEKRFIIVIPRPQVSTFNAIIKVDGKSHLIKRRKRKKINFHSLHVRNEIIINGF